MEARESLSPEGIFDRDLKKVKECHLNIQAKGISKCKGPEVGECSVHTRNNEEASVAGPKWEVRESPESRTEVH